MAKSVNGVGTATLFDGDSEIGDLEGGVHVRRYVPGPGIDAPVAIREGAGWVWPRRDRLGSVIARTNAGGIEGSAITYDPDFLRTQSIVDSFHPSSHHDPANRCGCESERCQRKYHAINYDAPQRRFTKVFA
ncbi:hypothetical protein [Hyphomonas sp.]|uniref:hypothetical protein n=1 Tax=Hyphomonas sp. TaxID=87 RepID=UPI0037C19E4F